jgi:hypothetical protein
VRTPLTNPNPCLSRSLVVNTYAQIRNLYRITYLVPSRVYPRFGTGGTYANKAQ